MCDRIDEWMMGYLSEFDGVSFQDVARGELDLQHLIEKNEDQSAEDAKQKDLGDTDTFSARIKELLADRVEDVRSTERLTDSPACLVVGEHDMGEQMRKIMQAAGQSVPDSKPILEVNMRHPLVEKLEAEENDEKATVLAGLLYDQAALSAGRPLENPAQFVQRLNQMMFELSLIHI